jgi:hypothetical protein
MDVLSEVLRVVRKYACASIQHILPSGWVATVRFAREIRGDNADCSEALIQITSGSLSQARVEQLCAVKSGAKCVQAPDDQDLAIGQ